MFYMLKKIKRKTYTLLLSENPCSIFWNYGVEEMHGLNYKDCTAHKNTNKSAYIAGFSNYVPKEDGEYKTGDDFFVYINLSRCNNVIETCLLVNHEMMHRAFELHDWNVDFEEQMITWAEEETAEVVKIINEIKSKQEGYTDIN